MVCTATFFGVKLLLLFGKLFHTTTETRSLWFCLDFGCRGWAAKRGDSMWHRASQHCCIQPHRLAWSHLISVQLSPWGCELSAFGFIKTLWTEVDIISRYSARFTVQVSPARFIQKHLGRWKSFLAQHEFNLLTVLTDWIRFTELPAQKVTWKWQLQKVALLGFRDKGIFLPFTLVREITLI